MHSEPRGGPTNRREASRRLAAFLASPFVFSRVAAAQPGPPRDPVTVVIDDLVASNRILSNENVIDAFGHVSSRHPLQPDHFLMSRGRAPALVEAADIMEFDAQGAAIDPAKGHPYLERFIHAAIYAARPDVHAVVHDHSVEILPFSVSDIPLRPLSHTGGLIGGEVPVWNIADHFGGATNLLVSNLAIGRDLAARLGSGSAVLMRGHGAVTAAKSIRMATFIAVNLNLQARLQADALKLGAPKFLSPDEVKASALNFDPASPGAAIERIWEYWCARARVPFEPGGA